MAPHKRQHHGRLSIKVLFLAVQAALTINAVLTQAEHQRYLRQEPPSEPPGAQEDSDFLLDLLEPSFNTTLPEQSNELPTRHAPFLGRPVVIEGFDQLVQPTARIVGGIETLAHPFYVLTLISHESYGWLYNGCGATLVSDCHVVSAAHCAWLPGYPIQGIFVNAHKPFEKGNGGNSFHFSEVEWTEIHPGYDTASKGSDLLVIKMKTCTDPANFPPAFLARNEDIGIQSRGSNSNQPDSLLNMQVLGFGRTYETAQGTAPVLREVGVPFISHEDCQKFYRNRLAGDMICAGDTVNGNKDACQGDSGSGMIHYKTTSNSDGWIARVPILVGVVSWGVGCGRKEYPGVYVSITYHRDWIMETICDETSNEERHPWCFGIAALSSSQFVPFDKSP